MPALPFARPLIKISGEALQGGGNASIDTGIVAAIAEDVTQACPHGAALVVGGGNIFRGLAGAAKGMDRVKADFMGMLATVMNALALQQAIMARGAKTEVYSGLPVPTVCPTFIRDQAKADLDRGAFVILAGGTGNPFFTTDTTAALRAAELGCDAIMKATQVDGVYSADPKTDPQAKRYHRVTFTDVLARDLKVMDAAAIALARDNAIPILVFALQGERPIGSVLRGEAPCTIVANAV
jgi:uridylate kinase